MKVRRYTAQVSGQVTLQAKNQREAMDYFRQLLADGLGLSNDHGYTQITVRKRRIRIVEREVRG